MSKTKFVDLKQKHIEKYDENAPKLDTTKLGIFTGAVVRAAAAAGWFEPPIDPAKVDEMNPSAVNQMAKDVIAEYQRVMGVSPE